MNALLQSLQQNPLWLVVLGIGVTLLMVLVVKYIGQYTSLREQKRRKIAKILKAHADAHCLQIEGHIGRLERELYDNLQRHVEGLSTYNPLPTTIRPTQSESSTTD